MTARELGGFVVVAASVVIGGSPQNRRIKSCDNPIPTNG